MPGQASGPAGTRAHGTGRVTGRWVVGRVLVGRVLVGHAGVGAWSTDRAGGRGPVRGAGTQLVLSRPASWDCRPDSAASTVALPCRAEYAAFCSAFVTSLYFTADGRCRAPSIDFLRTGR